MIIVSGLARSGTSLMMKMLEASGIPVLSDNVRKPDGNNIGGYLEVEKIGRRLEEDPNYLTFKSGCCKVLSPFLRYLHGEHRIIYMERNLDEITASMEKMSGSVVTAEQQSALGRHVEGMKDYLRKGDVLYLSYNQLVTDPRKEIKRLKNFIPELDLIKALQIIDKSQYRNRK